MISKPTVTSRKDPEMRMIKAEPEKRICPLCPGFLVLVAMDSFDLPVNASAEIGLQMIFGRNCTVSQIRPKKGSSEAGLVRIEARRSFMQLPEEFCP